MLFRLKKKKAPCNVFFLHATNRVRSNFYSGYVKLAHGRQNLECKIKVRGKVINLNANFMKRFKTVPGLRFKILAAATVQQAADRRPLFKNLF